MSKAEPGNGQGTESVLWRGMDFSGITVVLGVGTGRLIELLNTQAAAAGGVLIVINFGSPALKTLASLRESGPLTLIQARPRQIPVLSETVDLVVMNGVLREVPENRLGVMFEELWRALVPGGRLRVSDIIAPSEAEYDRAWAERSRIVRKLAEALGRPTALSVDLKRAALAARSAGFENLGITMLPGYALTDAWLQETVNALRGMAGGVVDRALRDEILNRDLNRLIAAYADGGQRAPERFVLQGTKVGDLALDMEASFTEQDLEPQA